MVEVVGGNGGCMRIWRALRATALGLLVTGFLGCAAGCADGGDRHAAVADAALRLLTAVRDGAGGAACAVLAPETAAEVAQTAGKGCADAILEEDLPTPAAVTRVDVYGQWGRVVLANDTMFLAVFPGGWRVVAAGCHSQGQRPYDCTVHGG